jgi:hypothetical protein
MLMVWMMWMMVWMMVNDVDNCMDGMDSDYMTICEVNGENNRYQEVNDKDVMLRFRVRSRAKSRLRSRVMRSKVRTRVGSRIVRSRVIKDDEGVRLGQGQGL